MSDKFASVTRLEAMSDAFIAIIITIMILELKVPEEATFNALQPLIPVFAAYFFSFQTIGTYWNNHHHLLRVAKKASPGVMWANLHLLFWLSLVPFSTAWLGHSFTENLPVAFYGFVLLMSGFAYQVLQITILKHHGRDSSLAEKIGHDLKGKISLFSYITAIIFAFIFPLISYILYIFVAVIWFIPDQRFENR